MKLRRRLENTDPVRKRIGAFLVGHTQLAFRRQRLGPFEWPERYPNQDAPFINVAGAIADFRGGRQRPKSRRFARRPALRDTTELLGSIAFDLRGDEVVEVGTTLPYARVHQFGGVATQILDEGTKDRIMKFIRSEAGEPYYFKLVAATAPDRTVWETQVNERPFLGIVGAEQAVKDIVEDELAA